MMDFLRILRGAAASACVFLMVGLIVLVVELVELCARLWSGLRGKGASYGRE